MARAQTWWPAAAMRAARVSPEVSFAAVRVSDTVSTAMLQARNGRDSSRRDMEFPQMNASASSRG